MSDALTTNAALDRTSEQGQSEQASAEAQATAVKQESSKKVNLHELPEYREVQSKMDRERAQLQQHIQQSAMQMHEEAMKHKNYQDELLRENRQLQDEVAKIKGDYDRLERGKLEMQA